MMMIVVTHDRRHNGTMCVLPMVDESNCDYFQDANSATWVYYLDGKKHGRIPPIVLPDLVDIFGGEDYIRQCGYRKHWEVFKDVDTNKYYFGNYPQFSKSPFESDRRQAESMVCVNIQLLITL